MLKGTRSIQLSYNVMIEGKPTVYMTASIPESGISNSSKTIQNLELYEANKAECRADMAAFDQMLYELEDGAVAEEQPETPEEPGEAVEV